MAEEVPKTGFQKFKGTKATIAIGAVLAIAVGVLMFYLNLFNACCGMGFILIGILMFVVLNIFGVDSTKLLVAVGILFFVIATAFGGLYVSKEFIDSNSNVGSYDSNGFSGVEITYLPSGDLSVSVKYTGDRTIDTSSVICNYGEMSFVCYKTYNNYSGDDYKHSMTLTGDVYTCTFKASDTKIGVFSFEAKSGDDNIVSIDGFYKGSINDNGLFSDYNLFTLQGNAYYTLIVTLMFMLVIFFTKWSKKNLEKNMAKLEAEGRLYPQGYGRCKECNSIVLPGETCCRKCGAVVELPEKYINSLEEIDYFECSDCGAKVPSDANVCPNCGAKFDEEE